MTRAAGFKAAAEPDSMISIRSSRLVFPILLDTSAYAFAEKYIGANYCGRPKAPELDHWVDVVEV
jgi:hypothetical protein